jgi:hypothetical protein
MIKQGWSGAKGGEFYSYALFFPSLFLAYLLSRKPESEYILNGATAPEIDSVEFAREIVAGEHRIYYAIRFHDAEGDVSTIEKESQGFGENWAWIQNGDINTLPSEQRKGAVWTSWFTCLRKHQISIVLIDALGNESLPFNHVVDCDNNS